MSAERRLGATALSGTSTERRAAARNSSGIRGVARVVFRGRDEHLALCHHPLFGYGRRYGYDPLRGRIIATSLLVSSGQRLGGGEASPENYSLATIFRRNGTAVQRWRVFVDRGAVSTGVESGRLGKTPLNNGPRASKGLR
jgi:hypothetical protein